MRKSYLVAGMLAVRTGFGALTLVPQPREIAVQGGHTDRTNVTVIVDRAVPPEGYRMKVSADGVEIASSDAAGAFYARQTLLQLAATVDGKGMWTLRVTEPLTGVASEKSFAVK